MDTTADRHVGYLLNVAVPHADGNGLGERAARLRLIPQRDDWTYAGRVREQLRFSPGAGELRRSRSRRASSSAARAERRQSPSLAPNGICGWPIWINAKTARPPASKSCGAKR
ncbi:MAG: hypothetical protein QM811_20415 [Pirellulales bacterium]